MRPRMPKQTGRNGVASLRLPRQRRKERGCGVTHDHTNPFPAFCLSTLRRTPAAEKHLCSSCGNRPSEFVIRTAREACHLRSPITALRRNKQPFAITGVRNMRCSAGRTVVPRSLVGAKRLQGNICFQSRANQNCHDIAILNSGV